MTAYLGFEHVYNSISGSFQCNSSSKENGQNNVWQQGHYINRLKRERNAELRHNFITFWNLRAILQYQAPVVQRPEIFTFWIGRYPTDKMVARISL